MAVAAKLGKNKEMKPQDKQTEVEDKKKGLTKREVESRLQKSQNQVKNPVSRFFTSSFAPCGQKGVYIRL